ncbi:MAG: type II toxin-antitoxin system Phd/YefM family antitoxin [Mycobacteriales bacterium]
MERIGVRELRQHASRYLARVKAGEVVEVTERGKLIALLVPPEPATTGRERLVATGRLLPASRPLRLPRRAPGAAATGAVLDALREDRL